MPVVCGRVSCFHMRAMWKTSAILTLSQARRSILKLLTEEQLNRYEAFRRSSLARRNMKRVSGV